MSWAGNQENHDAEVLVLLAALVLATRGIAQAQITRLTMSRCRRNIGLALVWGADIATSAAWRVAFTPASTSDARAGPAVERLGCGADAVMGGWGSLVFVPLLDLGN